jgi:hypothetical protein
VLCCAACAELSNSLQSYQEATKSSPSLPAAPEPEVRPAHKAVRIFTRSFTRSPILCSHALLEQQQSHRTAVTLQRVAQGAVSHRQKASSAWAPSLVSCAGARSADLAYCHVTVLQAPAAPAFGGFSWSKPAAAPAKAPEPAPAPAKTESSSSDMGSMFSSDMWNTPIKVRCT